MAPKEQAINEIDKAMREANCCVLDNQHLVRHITATIESRGNIMLIAPRGTGKTMSAKQAVDDMGLTEVYWNLSTKERVDIGGYPDMFNAGNSDFVKFKLIKDLEPLMIGGKVPALKSAVFANSEELTLETQSQVNNVIAWMRKFPQIKRLSISSNSEGISKSIIQYLEQNSSNDVQYVALAHSAPLKNNAVKFDVVEADPVECVLVLDEVDKADPSIWGPLLEIAQFHSVNGQKFPFLRSIVMTGNMIHEGGKRPLLPLLDRCECYFVKPSLDGFIEYSNTRKRIHPSVMSAVKDNPTFLFETADIENHYKDSTPRSMEAVSDLCYQFQEKKEKYNFSGHDEVAEKSVFNNRLQGLVGTQVGQSLIIYFEHYMDFLPVIRPMFDAVKDTNRKKAFEAVDKALEQIKKFETGTKTLVLFMTVMHNYINEINSKIMKYKAYNGSPFSKLAASQKKELDALNEETTILIDTVGYFFYRANSDVVSTSHGGNDTTLINGDLLCAILRNGVTQATKWQEYVSGNSYIQYLTDYVKRNAQRPEFSYEHYKNVDMKKMYRSTNSNAIQYTLYDHPLWHNVLISFASSQKSTIDKLKSLYGK
jgi:GTP-binding protein EngB required for normal cell division